MAWRFNPPPGWPAVPEGWVPPQGWTPDPSWPQAPPGWQFWVAEAEPGAAAPAPPLTPAPGGSSRTGGKPRRTSGRRAWVVVLVVLAGVVLLGVAAVAVSLAMRGHEATTLRTATSNSDVRIDNGCGAITVREGVEGAVSTEARVTVGWRRPTVTSQLEGSVVVVRVACPTFSFGGVDLVVDVPPQGSVEARSSAGSVKAEGLTSDLTLSSSAGSVSGSGLVSDRVSAKSSAGSVSLSWAAEADPTSVIATTSAGSVTVLVPDVAGVAYRVDAHTSAGSTSVDVRTDPQSSRTIEATSSAGSVRVGYR